MNLFEQLYADVNTHTKWVFEQTASTAGFKDVSGNLRECTFINRTDETWHMDMTQINVDYINTYQHIVNAFAQQQSKSNDLTIHVNTLKEVRECVLQSLSPLKYLHDFTIYEREDGDNLIISCYKSMIVESTEVLTEEPNTSLMYHKLFQNKRLLRDLEALGYTFQMGSGLKIYKKYYASTHRGSGPSKRRTLQSIVILKDGKLFRKIPKSKWVQLVDPSDKDSKTWGELFMKKMIEHEHNLKNIRKQKLLQKKKDRLSSTNT